VELPVGADIVGAGATTVSSGTEPARGVRGITSLVLAAVITPIVAPLIKPGVAHRDAVKGRISCISATRFVLQAAIPATDH
jgi:hypothetical protein